MGEYTEGVIKMSCCIFLQRFGKEKAMIKYEQTILHGVIIVLVVAIIASLTLAGLAVGRMRMAQDELDAVKADERTYREGYYATLARVEELEWQLEVINGGVTE